MLARYTLGKDEKDFGVMREAAEILERVNWAKALLGGWDEQTGWLTATEPDPEARQEIRDRLTVHIETLNWCLGHEMGVPVSMPLSPSPA
jgi:hypothetical protein